MPTPAQEIILREHCAHARYVWNLAVEQESWWRPGRGRVPNFAGQSRQLTEARREFDWLRAGSQCVQQQALKDYSDAMANFYRGVTGKPSWRKERRCEGFRVTHVGRLYHFQRLSRRVGAVQIPKIGWVKFRWSRPVPEGTKSYRVTMDRAGRWHVAFAAIPKPIPAPGTGEVIGVDRGVAVSAALSTGKLLSIPRLSPGRQQRLLILQRQIQKARPGSNRYKVLRQAIARMRGRERDMRRDWIEKVTTDLARRYDVIRIEDLNVANMSKSAIGAGWGVRRKTSLNREIMASGWGRLADRLQDKAAGRFEKINPRHTSMTCNACGHCEPGNRKSQAFRCLACGHEDHADVNAARNIARGYRVTARGGPQLGPANREPQVA